MGYVWPLVLGLGLVAGVFVVTVTGGVFYLFYWSKRPLYPRGNRVPVAPVTEAVEVRESAGAGEVVIDVQCSEYQIAALHQDLVEKLFPALGVPSTESARELMGPTRMLFTIKEETREELERLDLDGKRSRRGSRSKSMGDIALSPVGPLSPITSTPFSTPLSSPDNFLTPYGTPTYSPLVRLNRSLSSSPTLINPPNRALNDLPPNGSPPVGPPSPTRPTFPFLSRGSSPSNSPDFPPKMEASEWSPPLNNSSKLSPNFASTFYSPPRKPFVFATPVIHGKPVEGLVKVTSAFGSCTYVYENGTFSPSTPSSPQFGPPVSGIYTLGDHFDLENQQRKNLPTSTPPHFSPPTIERPGAPFLSNQRTCPSNTVVSTSPSYRPTSQRSSSILFPAALSRPHLNLTPVVVTDLSSMNSVPDTGSSTPTESTASHAS